MRASLFGATLLLLAVPVSGSALERGFYLTKKSVPATEATSACAPRYHMASIFELLQPGALHYDASVGMTVGDSGVGAPAGEQGWVRSGTAGREWSCDWWTNNTASFGGWVLVFALDQTKGPLSQFALVRCDKSRPVWCIED